MHRWSPVEVALLQRLVRDGLNSQQIFDALNEAGVPRSQRAIIRKIQEERKKHPADWLPPVPRSQARRFSQPIRIEADRIALVFDLHVPFHDAVWLEQVVEVAVRRGHRTISIGGDLVDFSAFSFYGRQTNVEAGDEIRLTRRVLEVLTTAFERVFYIGGNHEFRLARLTGGAIDLMGTLEMFCSMPGVTVSDYCWLEVISGGERFYIEHPQNVSMHATVVAKALCSKYLTHVIAGHGHLWGMTRDASGRFWAIDAGMCADAKRLAYAAQRHSKRPEMLTGAVLIEDGIPILLCPDNISLYNR